MKFRKNLMIPLFFLIVGLCSYIFIFPEPKEDYYSINVAGANWGNLEVLVEKQEDKNGQLILSHRRARVLRAWEKVNVALDTGEIVNGQIKSRTKGGMIAEVFGIEAFLPGSQIDVKPIRDYDLYVGRNMKFKVAPLK